MKYDMYTTFERSILFTGVKCMLDCYYWYMKDRDYEWDFPLSPGLANITDEYIRSHWGSDGETFRRVTGSSCIRL